MMWTMLAEIWRRYTMAGPAGWVSGAEKKEDKRRGNGPRARLGFHGPLDGGIPPCNRCCLAREPAVGYLHRLSQAQSGRLPRIDRLLKTAPFHATSGFPNPVSALSSRRR